MPRTIFFNGKTMSEFDARCLAHDIRLRSQACSNLADWHAESAASLMQAAVRQEEEYLALEDLLNAASEAKVAA